MSTLLNIFKNEKLKLPLVYKNGGSDIIQLLQDTFLELSDEIGKPENYLIVRRGNFDKINSYSAKIITTVNYWFQGHISEARKTFDTHLKQNLLQLPQRKVLADGIFYRVRTSEEHKILDRKSLFHIPFNLRNKVSTQRFSIPGFPCLYLGNSTYICWEELNRPQFHDIQAAKLKNTKEISLCNLSYEQYDLQKLDPAKITDDEAIKLLLAYPIIAACSIQVPQNRQFDPFKAEYIIPQIVLQTLMEEKDTGTIGVVYASTKIHRNKSESKGSFENFVLPTTSAVRPSGYCTNLTGLFDMTSAVAGWPVDFVSSYPTKSASVSFAVEKLDLDGIVVPYGITQFALLEKALGEKTPRPIELDFQKD